LQSACVCGETTERRRLECQGIRKLKALGRGGKTREKNQESKLAALQRKSSLPQEIAVDALLLEKNNTTKPPALKEEEEIINRTSKPF